MRKTFDDSSIAIHYIQQMLNETYNENVQVTGEYYTQYDMNYGFAHFIAKYLSAMYPMLDKKSAEEYKNNDGSAVRSITKPITITNYFLCSNNGERLTFTPMSSPTEYDEDINFNKLYKKLYNQYMVVNKVFDNYDNLTGYEPSYNVKFMKMNDLPLFIGYDRSSDTWSVNNNEIFTLSKWNIEKGICEIDNLVASYLLGRTIGPNSSMEDIYYAQKLLIRDREITREEKGVWCVKGAEGSIYDMTQTLINYQSQRVSIANEIPIIVTGYFDIYTESLLLKEVGEKSYGISGL